MNTDLNNEDFPRLTPPDVVYEHKDALKKKAVVIPLYAKITAVAAAVALLFGIFWFRTSLPEQELLAELKPIEAGHVVSDETQVLAESQAHFVVPRSVAKPVAKPVSHERVAMPLLAALQPKTVDRIAGEEFQPVLWGEDTYYAYVDQPLTDPSETYPYDDLSWVGRGIYKMTDGECDSFAALFSGGLRSFKTELASIETTVQSSRSQLRQMVR